MKLFLLFLLVPLGVVALYLQKKLMEANKPPTTKAVINKAYIMRDCIHDYEYLDDQYGALANGGSGSLADGGSYEIYKCTKCGKRQYIQLPD